MAGTDGIDHELLNTIRPHINAQVRVVAKGFMEHGALSILGGLAKPTGVTDPEREGEIIQNAREIAEEVAAVQEQTLPGLPELIERTYAFFLPQLVDLQQAYVKQVRAAEQAANLPPQH